MGAEIRLKEARLITVRLIAVRLKEARLIAVK